VDSEPESSQDQGLPEGSDLSGQQRMCEMSPAAVLAQMGIACVFFVGSLLLLQQIEGTLFGNDSVHRRGAAEILVAERIVLAALAVVLVGVLLRRNGEPWTSVGVRFDRPLSAGLWGIVGYITAYGYVLAFGLAFQLVWPGAVQAMKELQMRHIEHLPALNWAHAAVFSAAVSVSEEMIFRGFLVTRLRRLTGSWTGSVAAVSVVFAVLHIPQGAFAVGMIFGLSLILGFWMAFRSNVLIPIVAHALFDVTTLVILNYGVR